MNQFTTEIMYALARKEDLTEIFRQYLEAAINELLQTELTEFLGYSRYNRKGFNTGNSRNGKYLRAFDTKYGTLNLEIPRDRNGEFQQYTLPAYDRRSDALEETVIQLYRKGITTSEIAELIEKMYGSFYTLQTISTITKAVTEQVQAFHERTLHSQYVCIYLDATYLPLRRDTVAKEAIHLALGIRPDGTKEILNYQVAPTESAGIWRELLETLKNQGIEEALLFVTDRKEIMNDFKQIHQTKEKEQAVQALSNFLTKWQKRYSKIIKKLEEQENLLTFFEFQSSIRSSIYSTNLIEGFNKHLKRNTKKKEQFPNEESLDRFLVTQFLDYNNKHDGHCHRGFSHDRDTLESMFV